MCDITQTELFFLNIQAKRHPCGKTFFYFNAETKMSKFQWFALKSSIRKSKNSMMARFSTRPRSCETMV